LAIGEGIRRRVSKLLLPRPFQQSSPDFLVGPVRDMRLPFHERHPSRSRLVALLALLALAGCAASPTSHLRALADSQGFQRSFVTVDGFRHTVFQNRFPLQRRILHVYLEGDGSPWGRRTFIMADPTPRRPLMLRLMGEDRQAAVYVGRPCYNGTSRQPGCDNRLWTSDRYSPTVVASMSGVVRQEIRRRGATRVRLFGHSGGGALALLIAEGVPQVTDVVTVAGNLDTDAWTRHHGYTPLRGSLNPAMRDPLTDAVRQWHLLGQRDTVIPPVLVEGFLKSRPQAVVRVLPGFSHGCCWERVWTDVLLAVGSGRPERLPGKVPGPSIRVWPGFETVTPWQAGVRPGVRSDIRSESAPAPAAGPDGR